MSSKPFLSVFVALDEAVGVVFVVLTHLGQREEMRLVRRKRELVRAFLLLLFDLRFLHFKGWWLCRISTY